MSRALATKVAPLLASLSMLGSVAFAEKPDEADKPLVRVATSRGGQVYRAPDVNFAVYRRINLLPVTVEFRPGWIRSNGQFALSDQERLRVEMAGQFGNELERALFAHDTYLSTPETGLDVLRMNARVEDLEAPTADSDGPPGRHSLLTGGGSMTMIVELFDSTTGRLIGRIVDRERANDFRSSSSQFTGPSASSFESRVAFARVARLTREALK